MSFTLAYGYGYILGTFQRALTLFAPHGYRGYDPQIGHIIEFHAEVPEFPRQFRAQFMCPIEEFEEWVHGREPPAWRRWREIKENSNRSIARKIFQRVASSLIGKNCPSYPTKSSGGGWSG